VLLLEWAEGSHQFALNLLQLSNTRLHDSNAVSRSIHARAEALRAKAMTDSLTGLLNRHWLDVNQPWRQLDRGGHRSLQADQ